MSKIVTLYQCSKNVSGGFMYKYLLMIFTIYYFCSCANKPPELNRKGMQIKPNPEISINSPAESVQPKPNLKTKTKSIPYFYQYENEREPGGTCGITSVAMVLGYFKEVREPDVLYDIYGKARGQSPHEVAGIMREEGLYSSSTYTGNRQDIKKHLDAGRLIILHGDFTDSGHIIVLKGYDSKGWKVNDPAGLLAEGYGTGSKGENLHYSFNSEYDSLFSYDGDIWYSVTSEKQF